MSEEISAEEITRLTTTPIREFSFDDFKTAVSIFISTSQQQFIVINEKISQIETSIDQLKDINTGIETNNPAYA